MNNLTCDLCVCFSGIRLHLYDSFWHLWDQSTFVSLQCQQLSSLFADKLSQPIIMDSMWEEETWQQHFSPWHLQQKHLQSATVAYTTGNGDWVFFQLSLVQIVCAAIHDLCPGWHMADRQSCEASVLPVEMTPLLLEPESVTGSWFRMAGHVAVKRRLSVAA